MYLVVLSLHSLLRWVVVGLALLAVYRAYTGVATSRAWTPADDSAGRWLTRSLDVQLLLGVVLYGFLSPITTRAMSNMGEAMRDATQRFWAVEHVALMLVALGLAHVGRARARKASTAAGRHRAAAIFYTLAILAVLAAIPWPFMAAGRPLLRLGA